MPPKNFICSICGQEVSKRQSLLVDDSRVCKSHSEAKDQAKKNQAEFISKMLKDRQEVKSKSERHGRGHFNPANQLASYSLLGSLFRANMEAQAEKDRQAKEMLTCCFESKIYEYTFEHAGNLGFNKERLGPVVHQEYSDFSYKLLKGIDNPKDKSIIGDMMKSTGISLIDKLVESVCNATDDPTIVDKLINEWKDIEARHTVLFDRLSPGK